MRSKILVLCASVVGAVALLAAPAAAQGVDPFECTTMNGGDWTVKTFGACAVSCNPTEWSATAFCGTGSDCTGIEYNIVKNTGVTAALAYTLIRDVGLADDTDVVGDAQAVFPECVGDKGVGEYMCHEQVVKLTPNQDVNNAFRIAVRGNYVTTWTSVYFFKGPKTIESCRIPGLASDAALFSGSCVPSCGPPLPYQSNIKTEVINFEGCFAQFEYDLNSNGSLIDWGSVCKFADDPDACCLKPEYQDDVFCGCTGVDCCNHENFTGHTLYLTVPDPDDPDGDPLQLPVYFGDGSFGVGPASCTCTVINGAQVCWGRRCPRS